MLTKPEIACAIIECISSVREDEDLQDFVVEVEGTEFKCHRLILSACSGYFRGLFRSEMKESQKQRTKLECVSVETFTAILETLYTGCDNLTRDNMLNVWLAADQLQITFLFNICVDLIINNISNDNVITIWEVSSQLQHKSIIELCEKFLINNTSLEIWNIIYEAANTLGSDLILSHVRDFIKKNYEQIIKSDKFLCIREKDLLEIIKSQDLVVPTEDVVIDSILNWIKNESTIRSQTMVKNLNENLYIVSDEDEQDGKIENKKKNPTIKFENINEYRMNRFENFLSETRLFLVSSITLEKLSHDTLVMNNKRTSEMVMDAALYKSIGRQHGQSLKAAVHRSCSGLKNVAAQGRAYGKFEMFSLLPTLQASFLPVCPYLVKCTSVKLIAYQTNFIAVGGLEENSRLSFFIQNKWRELMELPGHGWLGVAVEEFIYLFHSSTQQIQRFDPRFGNCSLENLIIFPSLDKIEQLCSFDFFILAFCTENIKGVDKTAVHCFDTRSQRWTRLDSLEGSAKNIHSFRKEKQVFILQANGNLWEVNSGKTNDVHLKLVEVLWHGISNMFGVIYIDERLCFSLNKDYKDDVASSATSKLLKVTYVFISGVDNSLSNLVPAVVKSLVT